jgi:TolB-like protein
LADSEDRLHSEELKRKAEELKIRAFEEESRRLDEETEAKAPKLAQERLEEEEERHRRQMEGLAQEKLHDEQIRKAQEDEVQRVLEQERQKRLESRRKEEAEEKRREEQRRIQEDIARQKAEEQQIRRQQEEQRKKEEIGKKRQDLDSVRRDQERQRKDHDRKERVEALLKVAEKFYQTGDFEHAAIEVAKALVNDPSSAQALDLEQKIKDAQGKPRAVPVPEEVPVAEPQKPHLPTTSVQPRQSMATRYLIYALILGLIVLSTILVTKFKKKIFTTPVPIAILPWTSPTNILEDRILGTAFADEVSSRLEHTKAYITMGRASTYYLSKNTPNPALAAFHIGFAYALEGSIAQANKTIFVNLRLIDSSRNTFWENQYSAPLENAYELPEKIFSNLTEVLQTSVGDVQIPTESGRRRLNPDAYLLYLRASELFHRGTSESTLNAFQLYLQALQQDGQFPEALSKAALVLLTRIENGWDTTAASRLRVREYAESALVLDPAFGESYYVLGKLAEDQGKYERSLQLLDTALLSLPRSGDVYLSRARSYFKSGKYNEVIDAMSHAFELDPRNISVLSTFAWMHQLMGTPRQGIGYHEIAINVADDSLEYLTGPVGNMMLLDASLTLSYSQRVVTACQRRLNLDSSDYKTLYNLSRIYQITGNPLQATPLLTRLQGLLRGMLQRNPKDTRVMAYLALTLTRLGLYPEATAIAERAMDLEKYNAELHFHVARIYSLQMYSSLTKSYDEKKRSDAIRILKEALGLGYRFDELTDADFFNMYEHGDLHTATLSPTLRH